MIKAIVGRVNLVGLVLSLILIACFSLSGTGDGAVTIKVLFGNMTGGSPELTEILRKFEKENPGIKISAQFAAWNEVDSKFVTMLAGGEPPDVIYDDWLSGFPKYALDGLFLDLGPYIERDKKEIGYDDFWPSAWRACTVGGKIVGMPLRLWMGACTTYNATFFEEAGLPLPPTDWEDKSWNWNMMVEYAKKLTKIGADGKATRFGVNFWDNGPQLIQFPWAFGGDWFDIESYRKGIVNKVTLFTPENVHAYQAVVDLIHTHKVKPGGPLGWGVSTTNIAAGTVAMWLGTAWLQSDKSFQWGYAPFPSPVDGARDRAIGRRESLAIVKASPHPEEAWRFVKYMVSDKATYTVTDPNSIWKGQPVLWVQTGARKSSWTRYLEQWLNFKLSPLPARQLTQVITGSLERSVPLTYYIIAGSSEVMTPLQTEIQKAYRGQVAVATALETAQRVAEGAVAQLKRQMGK